MGNGIKHARVVLEILCWLVGPAVLALALWASPADARGHEPLVGNGDHERICVTAPAWLRSGR